MDPHLQRIVEAMKAAPSQSLPPDFASRVAAAALARQPAPARSGWLERLRRASAEFFAPRQTVLRPVWQVAWMLAACALGSALTFWSGFLPTPADSPREVWVRFAVQAPAARQVAVVGDFNGWNAEQTQLQDSEGDGLWHALVLLRPGLYQYMFIVDGETWMVDPLNSETVEDGFGQRNSLIKVQDVRHDAARKEI
jgi:hypothetical protein